MVERFKTTGRSERFGQSDSTNLFNAGVGGDRIQNVLYRLGSKGLYPKIKQRGVGVTILQMGTNDLRHNRPLTSQALDHYSLALEALRRTTSNITILVGGIYYRRDIPDAVVDQSNAALQLLVDDYNAISKTEGVHFVTPSPEIQNDLANVLDDHVHFNTKGYSTFAQSLLEEMAKHGLEL